MWWSQIIFSLAEIEIEYILYYKRSVVEEKMTSKVSNSANDDTHITFGQFYTIHNKLTIFVIDYITRAFWMDIFMW